MAGVRRVFGAMAVVMLLAVAACTADGNGDDRAASDATRATTSSTARPETSTTTVPPSTTTPEQALAAGLCPEVPPAQEPDPDRPRYDAFVRVDPRTGVVEGETTITFTPDVPTDRLVFRLWPNAMVETPSGDPAMDVGSVVRLEADGSSADLPVVRPDPTTVEAPVEGGLAAGEEIVVRVPFALTVTGPTSDRVSRDGDSMRLGSFLPLLPWEPGRGWAIDPPTRLFAEATTSPTADVEVTIEVPEGYDVLATGVPDGAGRWRAESVRDLAMSIGRFTVVSATAAAPDPVTVTVGVQQGLADDPQAYLDRLVASLEDFAARFGPYPWPVLTFALTPGLSGGIEMPTHIMQGPDTLGRTTPHEVGHMWFYSLVGNNQGRDPWLDEGLASYAEALFEGSLDDFAAEPQPPAAVGHLGEPLTYWADFPRAYYTGVYVQGAAAMASLGPPEQVDCALRHYVAANAFGLAEPADLFAALEVVFPDATGDLAPYGVAP